MRNLTYEYEHNWKTKIFNNEYCIGAPHRTQFFHFRIRFRRKSSASGPPPQLEILCPPLSRTNFSIQLQKPELEEIDVTLNVRIEHIATGTWLHGSRGKNSFNTI